MAKFNLKFKLEDKGFVLFLQWVEEGTEVRLIDRCWPQTPEEIEQLAIALFPKYRARITGSQAKNRINEIRRERYYKKLMPDVQEQEVPSSSRPGVFHTVKRIDKGKGIRYTCTCEGFKWTYRKQGGHCDHIRQVLGEETTNKAEEIQHRIVPILKMKLGKTLRTGDCDEFLEEDFQRKVTKGIQRLMLTSG